MWRVAFVVVYAAANAAAIALAGTAACGLRLQWYVALIALAFAMATLQTLVLFFAGVRVSAVRWWPLTLGATVSVTPLAFGVVYVFGVVRRLDAAGGVCRSVHRRTAVLRVPLPAG